MIDKKNVIKLKKMVDEGQKFALFGHHNIDGDAIWSILWFGWILEKLGKDVSYFTPKEPSEIYNFVPGIEKVRIDFDYGKYDVIVFMDFSPYDRIDRITDDNIKYFDKQTLIIIDHHLWDGPDSADLVIKDTEAMSNAEWVYEHIKRIWPEHIDETIATQLYLWVSTDSGNFTYDEGAQSARVLHNAAELVDLWADKKMIIDNMFRKNSRDSVQFMQEVLSRMEMHGPELLTSGFTEEEAKERGLDRFQAGFAMPIMQNIEWVKIIMFFKQNIQKWSMSCSFRWRWKYDVAAFAEFFGGGWHKNAAGCRVEVPDRDFDAAKAAMIARVLKAMKGSA